VAHIKTLKIGNTNSTRNPLEKKTKSLHITLTKMSLQKFSKQ